jgi:ABC-2 type transport system permease protein
MMKAFFLARKEIASFFHSWMGVLVYTLFVVMTGVFFFMLLSGYQRLSMEVVRGSVSELDHVSLTQFIFGSFFSNLGALFVVLIPILSMRAFSEEHKHQTLELLFTYPLSDYDIVAGKFVGLVWFLFLLILPSVGYVGFLHWAGVSLDWGMIASGYCGLLILGASYLSLGLFVSALTDNPVVTAMVTFGGLALLNVADWLGLTMDGRGSRIIQFFSPMGHFRDFTLGVIDLSHGVYFIFFCLYFLFLTLRVIESRNWKG